MHRTPSPTAAFWLAAFTYFIWGFTFLASRVAQNYGSPFVLLFWRCPHCGMGLPTREGNIQYCPHCGGKL